MKPNRFAPYASQTNLEWRSHRLANGNVGKNIRLSLNDHYRAKRASFGHKV